MNERTRRVILGGVIPVALAAAGLGPFLAYRSELPERVASHFDISGAADGSMTPGMLLVVTGCLMAVGLGACVTVALNRRRLQPMFAPGGSFAGAFIGAISAGILMTTAIGQRDLEQWQDATLSPWLLLAWLGGSVITATAAAWVASGLPFDRGTGPAGRPEAMELGSGERVFWSSTLSARWPLLLGTAVLLLALVLTRLAASWMVLLMLMIAIGLTTFGRVRVTTDRTGLQIRYGFLGWPRTSVPIGRIASAHAIDIRPADWGGWGYRGSLTLMKRAAVVLRAGPGIRLDLHDGRVLAVTIDDPHEPVRLLNAEVSRLAHDSMTPRRVEDHASGS